jgi:hopanoid-associated phosphorylase
METAPVLAVTCLAFESRCAAGFGVKVVCASGPAQLRAEIEATIARAGCRSIISFGVAGGLDATLSPGDWVIASSVVGEARRFSVDLGWARVLRAVLPRAVYADISGVDLPVVGPAEKRMLRQRHGTAAVDTESHIAAMVAEQRGLPFAAVRVVLDPAWRTLPPAALVPLRPGGVPDVPNVMRSLCQKPAQLGELVRITADTARALIALTRGRRLLGDRLGFADADEARFTAATELLPDAVAPPVRVRATTVVTRR